MAGRSFPPGQRSPSPDGHRGRRTRLIVGGVVAALLLLGVLGALAVAGHVFGPSGAALPGERFETVGAAPGAPPTNLLPVTPPSSPVTTTARACPDEVRRVVPGDANLTLDAGYETRTFRIYVCQSAPDRRYYYGVSKANSAQYIVLPSTPIDGGYQAVNRTGTDEYRYDITTTHLVVRHQGAVLLDEPVTGQL